MFFIIVFLVLFIFSLLSLSKERRYKKISVFIFFLLFILSSLRYSLGADYFSYAYIYDSVPCNIYRAITSDIHSEIGFKFLIVLSKAIGMPYQLFLSMISGFVLLLFGYTIIRKSVYPLISILIFYSTYYLIYVNSSIRQAIAMSLVFFSVNYFYMKRKNLHFIIFVFIATSFHITAVFSLLIYPSVLFYNKILLRKKRLLVKLILGTYVLFVLILNITNIPYYLFVDILGIARLEAYFTSNISIISLVSKMFFFLVISLLYFTSKNGNSTIKKYYMFYVTGILIYLLTMSAPISSRILEYFTMFEIIMIPYLFSVSKIEKKKRVVYIIFSFLMLVLLIKDLNSFTYQENYKEKGIFNYRYFTIFNKEEVFRYKENDRYLDILEGRHR